MQLAERFGLPVLSFVDTAGAYPGIDAEERGQAEAIARSIEACLQIEVPLVATVIGEGGSGGAIALAAGNRVLMLEHAVYSVISPEGCASILWRSAGQGAGRGRGAAADGAGFAEARHHRPIVAEPLGGAHRDKAAAIERGRRRDRGARSQPLLDARRTGAAGAAAREIPGNGREQPLAASVRLRAACSPRRARCAAAAARSLCRSSAAAG